MIVVDTSALAAIVLDEPLSDACSAVLKSDPDIALSAATLTEALIVAGRRGRGAIMAQLLGGLDIEVVPVTEAVARGAAAAYARWGKGTHPARLNFGDCFAYELAKSRSAKLLFVGDDFTKTDIESAL